MISFGLLTNKTRLSQRPPRTVLLANAQILAQVVPVRVIPRQVAKEPKKEPPAPEKNFQTRTAWKTSPSPLVQFPMDTSRFSGATRRPNPPMPNGNGKIQQFPEQHRANPPMQSITKSPSAPVNGEAGLKPVVPSSTVSPKPAEAGMDKGKANWPVEKGRPALNEPPAHNEQSFPPARIEATKGNFQARKPAKPGLRELLETNSKLPPQTVVLGVCEDGLPLALDLFDPSPGALLAIGDLRDEQITLLRTAVASACLRNTPRTMQFLVISHQPEPWKEWVSRNGFERHCISIECAQENTLRDPIVLLADWTEQRRLGQRSGPPILLVVDTLNFLPRLDYDIRLNFDWLVKEGPPAQIWTFAAISTELASSLGSRMLRSFQSRILGWAKDPQVYMHLAGLDQEQASQYSKPGRLTAQVGENLIDFQLPEN